MSIKKIICSLGVSSFLYIFLIKNFVYADIIDIPIKRIQYSPLYYIAISVVIAIVVGISILILTKIYKSNQLENEEENKKGEKK